MWPTSAVVEEALADPAWRTKPFREYVLKVHGRCNLSCDYCYMYEMADQSWRTKPATMSRETFDAAVARIVEHVEAHPEVEDISVVFHGGEPLMVGPAYLARAAETLRRAVPGRVRVDLSVQTNAVLLTEAMLKTLKAYGVGVGVSIDGGEEAHDRHRRYANGRGSHAAVLRGLDKLRQPEYAHLYHGLLCTVDIVNDPVELYEDLLALRPPVINLLLPHANWQLPPPGYADSTSETPYADWLIAIFDRWYGAPVKETGVRLFEEVMNLALGGASRSEAIGLSPAQMIVIETDGSVEQVDELKSAFEGAPQTGLSVYRDPFDAAALHPAVVARQRGVKALCATCLDCPVHRICGAGLYPHRYKEDTGFLNPSVYCADLRRLIVHVRDRLAADLARLTSAGDQARATTS
jgi:uncharacterized protein